MTICQRTMNNTRKLSNIVRSGDISTPRKRLRPTSTTQSSLCNNVELLTDIGLSSYQLGDYDNAEVCFSQALCRLDFGFLAATLESKTQGNEAEHDTNTQKTSEYDEGMGNFFEGPLALHNSNKQDVTVATLMYNVAQTNIKRGRYEDATLWFQRSLESCSISECPVLAAKNLHCLGNCYFRSGNACKAMAAYQQVPILTSSMGLQEKPLAAASLNCMGILYYLNTEPLQGTESAMDMFHESLELYRSCFVEQEDPLVIATVLNNIGRIHYLRSEFDEALVMYQEALQLRLELLGNESVDTGATIYNIGQTYLQLGQLDESLEHHKKFLKIALSFCGSESADVGLAYKGMADIYQEQSKSKMALHYYNLALKNQQIACGKFTLGVSGILNKLGNLCYEMKDFPSAMSYYKQGLEVEESMWTPCHPHIIITMTNIAHIHKHLGEHVKALEAYNKVRIMQEMSSESSKKESLELAETFSNIGLIQYRTGDYEPAFFSYQTALCIRRERLGMEDHPDIASTLNSIGLVLFRQEMYGLAKLSFSESLRIRSKILGKDHKDVAILWYNIATIHFEIGEDELAIQMFKETLRVERNSLGDDHPDVIMTLQHLGRVHQQLGFAEQALGYFQEALAIQRKRTAEDSSESSSLGQILNLLGNAYLQLGETKEMMGCFVEASRIFGEEGPLVISGYKFYGLSKTNPPCASVA